MADKFTIKFDAQMEIGQLKTAISQIQQEFKKIQIPQNATKPLVNTLEQLSKEVENFENLTSKSVGNKIDFGKIEKSSQHLLDLWQKLNSSYNNLTQLSDSKLKKLFPEEISNNIKKATTALKEYEKSTNDIDSNIKKIEESLKKAKEAQDKLTKDIEKENSKKIVDTEGFKAFQKEIQSTEKELADYKKKLEEINNFISQKETTLKTPKKSEPYRKAVQEAEALGKIVAEVQAKLDSLYNDSTNITTKEQHVKKLAEINEKYQEASQQVQNFSSQLKDARNSGLKESNEAFDTLATTLKNLLGLDISSLGTDSKEIGKAIEQYVTNKINQMRQSIEGAQAPIQNFGQAAQEASNKTHALGEEVRNFDQRAKEIDSIKARITAFFGLNNAIMLARRALRSAYDTVKELDKAMTETAVVTNFSVGDMWSQLPEYTKRANALGVTTLEAYQASTLFYQQGLKTNEVVALSNETLKMARIAGLDAAEATDRMTNALRGFNMTLTETNAQRIDDVYSKLAAITASNVDEISTAMTKVASLAHNANMEFETTSAFLAQIIETTRESAETAGTALKTVVARFSEVKDLYTKEELTGTDEEGEVIDVNKISKALRTAGIDLNRYFLGTVGLDDIFMELAEKWDSLTNVQQRYIATQAAGSRQQSRFIALMSDYARTQELVGAAYNANGAAAEQFEKTQDSLQSKLARLKNAWDEFTMGLANSTLIKTGVELLTGILTVVNKLTTGFGLLNGNVGSFVSALLKVGTVMGVRSLAKGPAAVLINSLGSVIGKGGISGKEAYLRSVFNNNSGQIGTLQDAGWATIFKQQFIGAFNNVKLARALKAEAFTNMGQGLGTAETWSNIGILGRLGTKVGQGTGLGTSLAGTKFASGLSSLLGFGGSSAGATAAAGVATLSAALVGVAAAATAAYGVIKMLYDASPQGQIKYAEQIRDEINHTKSSLEATKKTLDETLDSYNQQLDSLSKLEEGTIEWANAFIGVNKTVSDLIERFPKLVAYVTTTSDGLLQLDQKGLAQYQKELNEQIGKYSALSIMATGGVAQRKAMTLQGVEATGQQYLAEASFVAAAKSLTKGEYTDEIYKAFAKNFDFNKWAKDAGKEAGSGTGRFLGIGTGGGTKKQLREQYKELTGQEADQNWNKNQLKDAIGQFNNIDEIENYLQTISDILNKIANGQNNEENKQTATDILQGVNNQEAREFADGLTDSIFGSQELKDNIGNKIYDTIASGRGSGLGFSQEEIDTVKQNFERAFNWYKEISNLTDEEIFSAVQKDTIAEAGLEILRLIFESVESFDLTKDQVSEALTRDFGVDTSKTVTNYLDTIEGLTNEEYSKLGSVLAELDSRGIDIAETFGELSPEVAEILAALDVSDPDTIKMVFNALDSMGVEIDNEVIDRLINLADASTAAAEALDGINKSANLYKQASELKDRESYIFSGEEYAQYKEYDEEGFYQISDDLYVYIRDGFDRLIEGLNNKGQINDQNTIAALQGNIQSGEIIEAALQNIGPAISVLGEEKVKEELAKVYGGAFADMWTNYENLGQNRKILNQIGNSRAFYGSTKDLNNKTDIAAVFNSKSSKELLNYYNQANDSLKTQVKNVQELVTSEEERSAIAQKTALQYSEAIEQYSQLLSVISENKDLLLTEDEDSQFYQNAVQSVAQEIEQLYGLSHSAAVRFVEQHEKAIVKATESEEGFKNFLVKVAETWKNENSDLIQSTADAMGVSVSTINDMLTEIANSIKDLPDGEIGFNVKTNEALQQLEAYGFQVEDFMKSMGFELIAQPGSQIEVPNPGYAAMANIPAPGGGNLADAAGIPKTNNVTSTRFVWKRIGSADTGGVTPPGGGSPSGSAKTSEPPLQSDILKEQFEREQEKRNVGEKTEDKDLVQNFIDKAPDWILDIIAELRKEAGLELGDMRTLEIQEGDTTEILEWLQKYYDAKAEQIPEDTTEEKLREQINDLEAERDYKEKEGASDGDLAEIDEKIVDSLEQLIAILVEQNNGKYNAEIWNLFSKLTDVRNRGNEELENWLLEIDRYYNLNNLLERLADTGQDLIDTIDDSFNNSDSSGKEIVTNIVKAADVFAEELSAELYKSEALNTDRQNLLNKGSKFTAAGLIQIDDSGIVRQIADNIYNLQDSDKELYEEFQQWTSELDSIDNDIRSNESAIKGTYSKFDSLRSSLQQAQSTYVDLLKRTVDALISVQQDAIDTQKAINDSLNETGRNIIDGMREQIDLERQIRDNTKTEEEIRDMESRLAYLRRDTTGANAQEIMKLEKQIAEKRENYQDKLVDQRLQELQKQEQDAEKARNFQTQAMQERLDEQIKQGAFNNEASRIIKNSIDENGNLINDSALVQILQQSENWDALSEEERDIITTALNQQVNGAAAWLMSKEDGGFQSVINDVLGKESPLYEWLSGGEGGNLPDLIDHLLEGIAGFVKDELDQVNSEIENLKEMTASNNGKGTEETDSSDGTGNSSEEWQKIPTSYDYLQKLHEGWDKAKTGQSEKEFLVEKLMNLNPNLNSVDANKYLQEISKLYKIEGFATGGLNTLTGPAWLDGTPSRPEYVLNADQTQAFLRLAEVLPSIMRGNTTNSVDSVKNIYLNLTMNVDEIADDYDVDQIADRVKEILYDAGTYRNVNMLSLN